MFRARLAWLLACVPLLAAVPYEAEIAAWRQAREARLRADDGWLTVTGLFWLHEGDNRFGSAPRNEIVLPAGPAQSGTFTLHNRKVTVRGHGDGVSREIRPDTDESASVGRLRLFVIQRGDRLAVRMKDPDSALRRGFHGLDYFPVRPEYRVTARFISQPRKISIANIVGQTEAEESPGYVVFRLHGRQLRLTPVFDDPGSKNLFFIFKDETAGNATYGAGRFLDADPPRDGKVLLDFNKAYNPPCAFTPYATCPLPPRENRLTIRIEAGEKNYRHPAQASVFHSN